jgi:cytochrome c-type biogenesis protein CcmH/NrfG
VAKDAYKINPMDPEIFYILGKIALALGDKTTAVSNFKNSVSK